MPRCDRPTWIARTAPAVAALALATVIASPSAIAAGTDGARIYTEHCASCHGADRLGGQGPALIPESLQRLRKAAAEDAVKNGRPATQMPAFAPALDAGQIAAVVAHIYTPLAEVPTWSTAQIEDSRVLTPVPGVDDGKPAFAADPLNLFVVVESGDHHVTILDGDRFEPVHRFPSRFALHGGPKFTGDGRYVFFASRDGWVTKFDIYKLAVVAEVRAGINTRNIAVSDDGRFIAVANYLPHTLVILDASDLSVRRVLEVRDRTGKTPSRVSAVYQAAPRKSFIAALKDVPEVWEVATDDNAPPVHTGLVHSHEKGMEEALATESGLFALRRILLDEPIDDFFFDLPYRNLIGSSRDGNAAVVVNLNVGREIARVDLPGLPHLGSGITWTWNGNPVVATPHLKEGKVSVVDMTDWKVVKTLTTGGPGFFMRSHENTPYAWVDVFFGPNRDQLHIIDKNTLEIVRTLRPEPGKTAAHVEFTRDGRYALVSIWEDDGAIVVYDAATFEEIKRLPMRKPSGKYNVFNKITLSAGTSH
jgi:mono/diheme cytochrome c family protein/DNA-binding beta-propeller fold protein YncE